MKVKRIVWRGKDWPEKTARAIKVCGIMPRMQNPGPLGGMSLLIIMLLVLCAIVGIVMIIVRRAMGRMENGKASTVLPAAEERAPAPVPAVNQQRAPTGSYAKRCPTCRSIYADETLAFCLSDGSTLELVSDAPPPIQQRDSNATALYPRSQGDDISPTVQYQSGLTTDKKE